MKLRQTLFYRSFLKDVDLLVHHFGCLTAFSRMTISTIKEKRTEILKIARKRPDTRDLQTGLGYFSPIKTVIRNFIKVAPSILQSGQTSNNSGNLRKLPTNNSNNNNWTA